MEKQDPGFATPAGNGQVVRTSVTISNVMSSTETPLVQSSMADTFLFRLFLLAVVLVSLPFRSTGAGVASAWTLLL